MGRSSSIHASLTGTPSLHSTEYADAAADRALADSSRFAAGGRGLYGTRAPLPRLTPEIGSIRKIARRKTAA